MGKMLGLKDKETGELLVVFGLVRGKEVSETGIGALFHCRYLDEKVLALKRDHVYSSILDKVNPTYIQSSPTGEVPLLIRNSKSNLPKPCTGVWTSDIPPEVLLLIKMETFSAMDFYQEVK